MGRKTVQMALMRMDVPSSVTPQVGDVLLSSLLGLLAVSWWVCGTEHWESLSVCCALMLVLWHADFS